MKAYMEDYPQVKPKEGDYILLSQKLKKGKIIRKKLF